MELTSICLFYLVSAVSFMHSCFKFPSKKNSTTNSIQRHEWDLYNFKGVQPPYVHTGKYVPIIHQREPYYWFMWVFQKSVLRKLLESKLCNQFFKRSKELTESLAVFGAIDTYFKHLQRRNTNITFVCIGDGKWSRTAIIFSFLTGWRCISVDPQIPKNFDSKTKIESHSAKIEDITIECSVLTVAVFVHAHVDLEPSLRSLRVPPDGKLSVVSLPCCKWHRRHSVLFGATPDVEFIDYAIHSPHNLFRLWHDVKIS